MKPWRPSLLAILLSAFAVAFATAQTKKIDSLKAVLRLQNNQAEKLTILFLLCNERQSMNNDTLLMFARQAHKLAEIHHKPFKIVRANFFINTGLLKKGLSQQVIDSCNADLQLLSKTGQHNSLLLDIIHLKGVALIRNEQYKESIDNNFQLLQKAELLQDTLMQIKARNSIGWAYMEMGQFKNSIAWFRKALATAKNKSFYDRYPTIFNNISSCYNNIGMYDSATYFIDRSIQSKNSDLTSLANAKNIKADIFLNQHEIKKARQLLEEALEIRKQIGDPYYTISDLYQLSVFYANNGQPQKGIETANLGIEEARKHSLNSKLPLLYAGLAESYKMGGDLENYVSVLENIIQLKDTLFEKNSAEALANLQARYDIQKKENIIMQQKLDILKRDYFITGSVLVFVVVLMAAFFFYFNYRNRQKIKLKKIIEDQQVREQHAVHDAEEIQRKRIAAELHDNMGAQISFINSNIDWMIDSPAPLTGEEQKKRLQIINETSHGLMRSLRETIWALSRDQINIEEFSDKLKAYIQSFIQFQPGMHFRVLENIEYNISLKPVQALNIFRIFQEGVNNALKYSKAKNLELNVVAKSHQFEIRLEDDGIGFKPDRINGEHFGLQIMENRAKEAGYIFTIKTAIDKGTAITVAGLL